MNSSQPHPIAAFVRTVTRIDKSKINTRWLAFRNALAVALPLGISIAEGKPLGGVAVSTGALNVSYSDGRDPYSQRARRMFTWSFLGALAVFVGSVTGKYHWAAIPVVIVWAFVGGMCVAVSSKAGDLGLNTLVILIVFAARGAMPVRGALIAAGLVLGGGLLQTVLALAFWPLRRYQPERRAIGEVYVELAKQVGPQNDPLLSGPLSPLPQQIQDAVAALGRDHSLEGERLRLLYDQADRIRLSIYLLHRLRAEIEHADKQNSTPETSAAECIDHMLDTSCKLLSLVGNCLVSGESSPELGDLRQQMEQFLDSARRLSTQSSAPLAAEVAFAVDTLAGQLRTVVDLSNHTMPEGMEQFAEREAAQPWRLQIAGWIATLRANLDLHSAAFRHAVRLAVAVSLGDALGRFITGQRSYWLPMTVAVVLKPDFTTTFSRGVLRLLGTFVGLVLATVLYHALPASPWRQLFLVGIFMFLMRWFGPANYGAFSICISGLIVFLVAATGVSPGQVVVERAVYTAVGGVFALVAYAVWPTWERKQVSEVVSDMLDATRNYFRAVVERFGREDQILETALNETRRAWRRARSNAEASVDRVSAEPGITPERLNCLNSILASSHALMHAIMGLEAGIIQNPPRTPPEVFKKFANDVEFTLYFLAAALRGSPAANRALPKLREDHTRLVASREAFSPTDEFVLIETDRITTTLNTLREQVMRCLPQKQITL